MPYRARRTELVHDVFRLLTDVRCIAPTAEEIAEMQAAAEGRLPQVVQKCGAHPLDRIFG